MISKQNFLPESSSGWTDVAVVSTVQAAAAEVESGVKDICGGLVSALLEGFFMGWVFNGKESTNAS